MLKQLSHTLSMIKFSHSIFALPFALAAVFLAAQGFPSIRILSLIILAMVTARNTAMAFNRWLDADIDAQNPRTANRHIPAGLLSKKFVILFAMINSVLFILTCWFINSLAFYLAPLALAILFFYSVTKRFTHYTQIFLGLSLGIAPIGAWIAFTGSIQLPPILLGLSVLFWVAGFDVLYATQDYEFDRQSQLKSLVVRFGIPKALKLAQFFHALSILSFISLGISLQLSPIYFTTILAMAIIFIFEHQLIKPNDLSKLNMAFFTANGFVGILFLIGVLLEVFL